MPFYCQMKHFEIELHRFLINKAVTPTIQN